MGKITCETIQQHPSFELVAKTTRGDPLAQCIADHAADIVIDLTVAGLGFKNATCIIEAGAKAVIGTSGLTEKEMNALTTLCASKKQGAILVPNFSIGALLMIQYAKQVARYLPDMEIIEMHHANKVDAPSGTAHYTASQLQAVRKETHGENRKDIPIHSVRLPGLFSHQTILFGAEGEGLTIRHDAYSRACMMPGIRLACEKVMALNHLVVGLESFLFSEK